MSAKLVDKDTNVLVHGYIKEIKSLSRSSDANDIPSITNKIANICISFTKEAFITQEPISFPPQNKYYSMVSSAYKLFLESINGTENDGWIYQGEKQGVSKYKKDTSSSPFSLFRGEKILNYPQNVLIHAIRNKKIRLLVGDGEMVDCGPLEIIDENCIVQFEEYRSPAPFVGARDFVYIDTIHRLSDGTVLSFASSVLHPQRPICNRFTRADLKIGGWAFHGIAGEPDKTRVIYLVSCDLAGYVPGWIINQIASHIPLSVERLNTSLQQFHDIQQFDKPLMDVLLKDGEHVTDCLCICDT